MLCDNPAGILLRDVSRTEDECVSWFFSAPHSRVQRAMQFTFLQRPPAGRKCLLYLTPVVLASRSSCSTCREATNFGGEIIKEGIRFERSIIATNVSTHLTWTGNVAMFALCYSSSWLSAQPNVTLQISVTEIREQARNMPYSELHDSQV